MKISGFEGTVIIQTLKIFEKKSSIPIPLLLSQLYRKQDCP